MIKTSTLGEIDVDVLRAIGETVATLSRHEGLPFHGLAVERKLGGPAT
jgi:hypothetical protein